MRPAQAIAISSPATSYTTILLTAASPSPLMALPRQWYLPQPSPSVYLATPSPITYVTRNGFQVPGAGAGVGIFAPFPGTRNSDNVVIENELTDNGLPGVTMHNHAAAPAPAPPVNMNNNMIIGNRISGNGKDTEDAATSGPTGINIFSVAPVAGTVVSQNRIDREPIALAFNAPSGQIIAHLNNFDIRGTDVDNIGTGLVVDATFNWWGCPTGPGTDACSTIVQPA